MQTPQVQLVECPRDAMQGIKTWIPTPHKIAYLQSLLNCGFHTLDFGSFVSPKAIPQMADTAEVLAGLDLSRTKTELLAIVANLRGAEQAAKHKQIKYLGYPFSISENFQMRNTHQTISESVHILKEICALSQSSNQQVVAYLSMGFGNPYGDPWSPELVAHWVGKLVEMGIEIISLSDTVGTARIESIERAFSALIPQYPQVVFGAHLHTNPKHWHEKLTASLRGGCRRFDGAIQGCGGCPMAMDALTGNMPTEKMLSHFTAQKMETGVSWMAFEAAHNKATALFTQYT
jgi:hydroxymethylglutaryl-CoA lyase